MKRVKQGSSLTRSKKQSNNNEKIQNIPANFPEHPESVIPLEDDLEREDGEHTLVEDAEPQAVLLSLRQTSVLSVTVIIRREGKKLLTSPSSV